MPRQKKEKDARRTEQVNPRFTPAERVKLESNAVAAGLSASEFVRRMALTGRVVVEQRRGLEHAVFDELKRIGNNLNQLARIANLSGRTPARLDQALENLDRILTRELDHDP